MCVLFFLLSGINGFVLAQGEKEKKAEEIFTDTEVTEDEAPAKDEKIIDFKNKSDAYRVLGRQLTTKEKASFGNDLTYDDLKSQILIREPDLTEVRALISVGAGKNAGDIVKILHFDKPKTYEELIKYFVNLREKYGSIPKGIEIESKYNFDEKQIFEGTVAKAYETVYGVSIDDFTAKEKEELFNYLKSKQAITYSDIVEELENSMTDEEKQSILFEILDKIGRPDLKEKEDFVKQITKQKFTYDELEKLLQELKK